MASRGLLFDLDGTLALTDPLHEEAWRSVLAEASVELTSAGYLDRIRGRANDAIVAMWLPHLHPGVRASIIADKEQRFRDQARGLLCPEGLVALLDEAERRGWVLAVVTNAPIANAEHVLEVLGLRERFTVLVGAESVTTHKPAPEPYQLALSRLELTPAQAVAFEDSPSGVLSAVAAGLMTIGMLTGHSAEELTVAGAAVVSPTFAGSGLLERLVEALA